MYLLKICTPPWLPSDDGFKDGRIIADNILYSHKIYIRYHVVPIRIRTSILIPSFRSGNYIVTRRSSFAVYRYVSENIVYVYIRYINCRYNVVAPTPDAAAILYSA